MIDEIQKLATLGATVFGVGIALNGLGTWKREMTGKRDIELCQTVIQKFYEGEEVLSTMRSPMSNSSESAERPRDDHETDGVGRQRDSSYVPVARFIRHIDFWLSLLSYKWQMRALFGDTVVEPFNEVDMIIREFRTAAFMRYEMTRNDEEQDRDLRRSFQDTLWEHKGDPISERMKAAVKSMEEVCIPIVRHNTEAGWLSIQLNKLTNWTL